MDKAWFGSCTEIKDFIKANSDFEHVYVNAWEGSIFPPYIVISADGLEKVDADNIAYVKKRKFYVTLFKKKHDDSSANKLESLFDENEIPYESTVSWLNDLRLEAVEYEI